MANACHQPFLAVRVEATAIDSVRRIWPTAQKRTKNLHEKVR